MNDRDGPDWHDWYIEAVRIANEARPDLAVGEIVRSWLRIARPVATRVQPAALSAEMLRGDDASIYWLTPPPPSNSIELHIDLGWAVLRMADGSEKRYLVYDPLRPETWGPRTTHAIRRGFRRWKSAGVPVRSSPDARTVARALAIRGLIEAGMTHGAALRTWVQWPESEPPATMRELVGRIASRAPGSRHLPQLERDGRFEDRMAWRGWDRAMHTEHRRIWSEHGFGDPARLHMLTLG